MSWQNLWNSKVRICGYELSNEYITCIGDYISNFFSEFTIAMGELKF